MEMKWKEVKLGDICTVTMGQSPKGESCNPLGDGIPLLNGPTEFGSYSPEPVQFTTDPKRVCQEKDLLFCVRGSTTGRMNWANKKYAIGRGLASIHHKKGEELRYFVKGLIEYNLDKILGSATGSTFPNVSKVLLNNLEISVPPLEKQEKIASILKSLDDKIEVNNQMNQALEEMGQTIFKEWFVEFNFPNEDGVPYKDNGGEMVESELGMIPKGWRVEGLGGNKNLKLLGSGIDDFEGEKNYLATADVEDTSIKNNTTTISYNKKPSRANMQPVKKSIWFAKMKDSRKLILVNEKSYDLLENYIFSTGFAGIVVKNTGLYYYWNYISGDKFNTEKNNLCNGTTMQAINNTNIKLLKIIVPSEKILKIFDEKTSNFFEKIEMNSQENEILIKTRDTLLPKLMSGEVRV